MDFKAIWSGYKYWIIGAIVLIAAYVIWKSRKSDEEDAPKKIDTEPTVEELAMNQSDVPVTVAAADAQEKAQLDQAIQIASGRTSISA